MNRQKHRLGNALLKVSDDITLWKTERGVVRTSKGTLAIPINLDGQLKGYVFHGRGVLILDTVVETEEGAVGRSVERVISDAFLMLGDTTEMQQGYTTADSEDLTRLGYENEQDFAAKAGGLLDQFFHGDDRCSQDSNGGHGFIFAFQNEVGGFDVLLAKGSKLVYKARDMAFLLNGSKAVLKTVDEVVLSGSRKSFIIK